VPLERQRSFSADSPVGRYWLLRCVGFRVTGSRRARGVVEEAAAGADGVDVLAVRRRRLLGRRVVVVRADRVASVDPWRGRIVLARRRRGARAAALAAVAWACTRAAGRAVRAGAVLVAGLIVSLAAVIRRRAPGAGRKAAAAAAAAAAYAAAAGRAAGAGARAFDARLDARRAASARKPPADPPAPEAEPERPLRRVV
jgi:hypothetical protein